MRLDNFSEYEKNIKRVYCVCTKNIIDKPEYFSTKKEAIKACKALKNSYPKYDHAVDMLEWSDWLNWYTFIERVIEI